MRALFAKLKAEASFLVLLAVAAVGSWMYAQYRQTVADRDDLTHRVELICTASGTGFAASGKVARGKACLARVAALADFKAHTDEITAKTLAAALAAHDARQQQDGRAALAAALASRDAATIMEQADAEAERRNLVDRDWFAAVNGVAGLRAPPGPAR